MLEARQLNAKRRKLRRPETRSRAAARAAIRLRNSRKIGCGKYPH
jgi:hypothetical protein